VDAPAFNLPAERRLLPGAVAKRDGVAMTAKDEVGTGPAAVDTRHQIGAPGIAGNDPGRDPTLRQIRRQLAREPFLPALLGSRVVTQHPLQKRDAIRIRQRRLPGSGGGTGLPRRDLT